MRSKILDSRREKRPRPVPRVDCAMPPRLPLRRRHPESTFTPHLFALCSASLKLWHGTWPPAAALKSRPIESFIRGDAMRKTLTMIVAAATFAAAAIAAPGTAAARWGWRGSMVYYDYLA